MSGMASFLVGMGGGYLKAKDKEYERDRQAKEDAWRDEQRGRQRSEWTKADKLEADVADAARPMAAAAGHQITDAAGSNAFTKDADAAAMMTDMAQAKNGQATSAAATRVGEQSYTDPVQADKALTAANSEQGVAQRMAQAYRNNGKPLEANQMQSAAMDLRAKQLGLSEAEATHADKTFNRILAQKVTMEKGWGANFAKVLTDTGVGGLNGVTFNAVYAPDGKSFELVGVGADGTKSSKGVFTDDEQGWAKAMRQANSATLETKISYVVEDAKAQREAQELAIKQQQADARDRQVDAMAHKMMGGGASGGAGGSGGRGGQGPGGINMDAIDKTLTGLFSKEDPTTGAKSLNTAGLAAVRQLALRTPAAANGDSTGAALQAYNAYEAALTKAGGDSAVAMQMLNAAMAPPQAPVPQATPIGAPSAPAAAPVTNMRTAVAAPSKAMEPKGRVEFQQFQEAAQLGYQPAGRGNAMFGAGEVLYINPNTGDRKYASQLFGK